LNTPALNSWAGFAFERICYKHAAQIKEKLGLSHISTQQSSWRYLPPKGNSTRGTQIDLIFDRNDDVITLCEIKYAQNKFKLDKAFAKELMNKVTVFEDHYKTKKQITTALVTTHPPKLSIWAEDLISHVITLDDLFK